MRAPSPCQVLAITLVGLTTAAVAARPASLRGQPFDYVVEAGQTVILDTSSSILTSASGQTLAFSNGQFFFDSFEVKPGGQILAQGPNPLRFFVNNFVKIHGTISVNGSNAKPVATLLTAGLFTQPGATGHCGAGDGGTGNPTTSMSSVQGGGGLGPGGSVNGGGGGGESSLLAQTIIGAPCFENEDRHPAGGGGGSYGTSGEPGAAGTKGTWTVGGCQVVNGKSAVNSAHEPFGGGAGPATFVNPDATDDFLGATLRSATSGLSASDGTILVPLTPIFTPSDVGRFVGVYRTNGSFEDQTLGCLNAQSQANPVSCPRSRYLVRRITAVAPTGVATIAQLPGPVLAGDVATVFRPDAPVAGELPSRRGGQGGGAGGNAVNSLTFPNPGYANSDRSGAGGGAGGGLLEIYCWGPIDLTNGVLTANGGNGAGGENTIGLDRLGGGSGGGSGGMIRVQSNEVVNLTNASLLARGGSRGPGAFEFVTDPIPPSVPTGMGHGGRGGKGIVQVHAPLGDDGNAKIVFSPGEPLSMKFDPAPVFGTPEFFADPARQRASWFGQ